MNRPPNTTLPAARPAWTAELALRARRYFWLKLIGTSAFTALFFVGYFHLLRFPAYPVLVMPLTALDRLIPFQAPTLFAYLSLWFYIGIAPGLQLTFRELLVYGLWIAALCPSGLAIFYNWPTAVPPLALDVSGFVGFDMLQGIDAAGNACPSMHVAVAIFTAIWIDHVLRQARAPWSLRLVNIAWFAAIAWSTLAIKQHVVLDVAAGALLGLGFALASLHWRPGVRRAGRRPMRADIIERLSTDNAP
jgi:membrane-associated phospholipid phosphatase